MPVGTVRAIAWPVLRACLPTLLTAGPLWALLHERRELLNEIAQAEHRAEQKHFLHMRRLEYLTGRADQIEAVLRDTAGAPMDASRLVSALTQDVQHARATLAPATDDDTRWIHARWHQLVDRLRALATDSNPIPW